MAVTAASFKAAFPEFANATEALVTATLERAVLDCPSDAWGQVTDRGIELTAAQSLALSPFGRGAQLVSKDGSTVYDERLECLKRGVALGAVTVAGN